MNKFVKLGINFGLIGIVTAGLIVGNNVVKEHESEIDTQLAPPIVDKQSQEVSGSKGQEMASRLIREGSVMLKNADNTLPLSKENKQVNVFGWRSVDWIYGSEGKNASGGVSPDHFDFDENIDIYKALEKYGVAYNKKLYDMYYQFRKPNHQSANIKGTHINNLTPLKEPFITDKKYYTDELLNYSQSFSDTAIVVIGRMAGEGMNADTKTQVKEGPGAVNDETRHYLEISKEEEELLKYCGKNFKNVVVLLNVANPFECGFLNDIPGIDACLYIGFTGTQAAVALPGLLYGDVSPSGHTIDTFAYDLFSNPANTWVGGEKFTDFNVTYTDHMENIYVGYKWYETADTMGIWNDVNNNYGKGYDGVVQFPFGYGLSYNTYSWKVGSITKVTEVEEVKDGKTVKTEKETPFAPGDSFTDKDKLVFPVTVKNNGEYPGQDVVEIYVTAPWTQGGIEKSSVMLSAFEKTSVLQPGQEEEIKLEIDPYDFASYDCYDKDSNNFKGWELEGGDYTFKVQTDSHHVKEVEYDSKVKPGEFTFKIDSTINVYVKK